MKTISAALQAHYASGATTLAILVKVTRVDGQEFGLTSHDRAIFYPTGVSGQLYETGQNSPTLAAIVRSAGQRGQLRDRGRYRGSQYFEQMVRSIVSTLQSKREGIFQIDLQLRPYGKAGSMAVSLDSFRRYYAPDGPAWAYERQALVKLRPIIGDTALSEELIRLRDQYSYESGLFDVTAMRAMRERQVRHLVTGGTFNAKFSRGGLVDIEYLIQGLQIIHGAQNPSLRLTNLRAAMSALHAAGILSSDDYTRLHKAYTFLRWLIDSLRVVRGNSRDVPMPPFGSDEFVFLARRLRYEADVEQLRDELARYVADLQEINTRLFSRKE